MTKTAFLGSLALVLLAGAALAQEPAPPADDPQQDEQAMDESAYEPARTTIRVLDNPYNLSSYYRSSQGGFYDYRPQGGAYQDRYPIAGYYRMRSSGYPMGYPMGYGGGYAPFWNQGYSSSQAGFALRYRQRIGQNGDLFLFFPTFLAPIGPLTGAFFFGR